jgi:hypothetical protein
MQHVEKRAGRRQWLAHQETEAHLFLTDAANLVVPFAEAFAEKSENCRTSSVVYLLMNWRKFSAAAGT